MGTLDYSGFNSPINMFTIDLTEVLDSDLLSQSPTEVVFGTLPANAHQIATLGGTGFAVDAMGDFSSGTTTSVRFDNSGVLQFFLTNISIPATSFNNLAPGTAAMMGLLLGGGDTVLGSPFGDGLMGLGGNDSVNGGAGADSLDGGAGNDTVAGGTEADTLIGLDGDDTLHGGDANDQLFAGLGNDVIDGGLGDDFARTSNGNDSVFGGDGDDTLGAGSGKDFLRGNAGADLLLASNGNDTLTGDTGNDTLLGGGGSDLLTGGAGDDRLVGGTESDRFNFAPGSGADIIVDFAAGAASGDVIGLFGYGAALNSFAEVIAASKQVGGAVVIDLGGGDTITLQSVALATLTAGDFVFG